jgi:transposase-like protein
MKGKKRQHTPVFKAKVALEAIRENKSQAEITSHYEVHTTQVRRWKSEALAAIESCFSQRRERQAKEENELQTSLYEQIGKLQMELQFLKKKSGLEPNG